MHMQRPFIDGQPVPTHHDGVWPERVPPLPAGQFSFMSWAKAAARSQRACPHDGGTRPVDAYSDLDQCVLCDLVLPLAPLPEVDLDDAGSELAWAVAFAQRPPAFPGVLALVELSRRIRRADASWATRMFADDLGGLRRLGHTPRSYLAMCE
ncbi:hypothetical protein [Agrococcus sp. HG114]|uniref:hypothetical protein n=1 Tax=Agrococcus sp. HG114 TaxID=2969757 RepID=UPI00215AE30B|nr:hypothetical protein [Agrococcus sp. HG114]MCR8669577.1 hypothetical protein [Agrococcus sp. HG114]